MPKLPFILAAAKELRAESRQIAFSPKPAPSSPLSSPPNHQAYDPFFPISNVKRHNHIMLASLLAVLRQFIKLLLQLRDVRVHFLHCCLQGLTWCRFDQDGKTISTYFLHCCK